MAVPGQASADHCPGQHVEGGEQGGGAVALVVVGHRGGAALRHRQRRLGPVQGLDLALLVHTQHHGVLRRIEVEPDHVNELALELRVGGELERLDQVRLESAGRPDPRRHHRRRRQTTTATPTACATTTPAATPSGAPPPETPANPYADHRHRVGKFDDHPWGTSASAIRVAARSVIGAVEGVGGVLVEHATQLLGSRHAQGVLGAGVAGLELGEFGRSAPRAGG